MATAEISTETARSSTESTGESGLDYEETALTLGLPGKSTLAAVERKRGFAKTVELTLGGEKIDPNCATKRSDPAGDPSSNEPVDRGSSRAAKPPAAKAQVVGWPPVRSYRKNALKSCTYVKVAVDGAPYLRKVDLETFSGYEQLLKALEDMFSCFTIRNYPDERRLVDPMNGTEYVPTYEDKDGDWMLVGDVPWKMFVGSCKRLRLMKSSEAVNLAPRSNAQ